MKIKLDRIISIATLVASLVAIVLVLKRPAPVAVPQPPAVVAANAESFDQKLAQLQQSAEGSQNTTGAASQAQPDSSPATSTPPEKAAVHINSGEMNAIVAQSLGTAAAGLSQLTPDSNLGSGAPTIKDQQISFDGDLVHGQFLTEIAGKDVWITISGHIGSKDGYASFDPTEFKVGDLNVPVSLVNSALQQKLSEQRDRLKLPDFVGGMKVENGELVLTQK